MWVYEKRLQYPVKINNLTSALAYIIITQSGGRNRFLRCMIAAFGENYPRR